MQTLHSLHPIDTEVGQLGVTVRLGSKWADLVTHADQLELCVCTEDGMHIVVGHGTVEEVWCSPFYQIPARVIELEHEESSRVYSGLIHSMSRAYGSKFDEESTVTVLTYLRND